MNPSTNPTQPSLPSALTALHDKLEPVALDAAGTVNAVLFSHAAVVQQGDAEFKRSLKLLENDLKLLPVIPFVQNSIEIFIDETGYDITDDRGIISILRGFSKWMVDHHGPALLVSDVTEIMVNTWKAYLGSLPLSPDTKNHYVALVGSWIRFCVEQLWMAKHLMPRKSKKVGFMGPKRTVLCWTLSQSLELLTRALLYRPDVVGPLVVMLILGVPMSAVVNLYGRNFDRTRRLLTVPGNMVRGHAPLTIPLAANLDKWLPGLAPDQRLCRLN